ncbi:MAG: hypothetical protein U5M50_10665 [Sphingobium sp.]|nr:hypothetical protein [Sphingobium sp.]
MTYPVMKPRNSQVPLAPIRARQASQIAPPIDMLTGKRHQPAQPIIGAAVVIAVDRDRADSLNDAQVRF